MVVWREEDEAMEGKGWRGRRGLKEEIRMVWKEGGMEGKRN